MPELDGRIVIRVQEVPSANPLHNLQIGARARSVHLGKTALVEYQIHGPRLQPADGEMRENTDVEALPVRGRHRTLAEQPHPLPGKRRQRHIGANGRHLGNIEDQVFARRSPQQRLKGLPAEAAADLDDHRIWRPAQQPFNLGGVVGVAQSLDRNHVRPPPHPRRISDQGKVGRFQTAHRLKQIPVVAPLRYDRPAAQQRGPVSQAVIVAVAGSGGETFAVEILQQPPQAFQIFRAESGDQIAVVDRDPFRPQAAHGELGRRMCGFLASELVGGGDPPQHFPIGLVIPVSAMVLKPRRKRGAPVLRIQPKVVVQQILRWIVNGAVGPAAQA